MYPPADRLNKFAIITYKNVLTRRCSGIKVRNAMISAMKTRILVYLEKKFKGFFIYYMEKEGCGLSSI